MMRRAILGVVVCALVLSGCPDDGAAPGSDGTGTGDGGTADALADAGDAAGGADVAADAADAMPDTTGGDAGAADAVLPDAGAPDAAGDAAGDAVIDVGPGPDGGADVGPNDTADTSDAPGPGDALDAADGGPPLPAGCCDAGGSCPAGQMCIDPALGGTPTCVPTPEPGRCWVDADCEAGQTCHGAAKCPCDVDCDMAYEGPGVCAPAAGCASIQVSWVQEICDAKSIAVWNGASCIATCPGCCGCEPFCELTFDSLAECEAACGPPLCAAWDGSCDDAIPPAPWWAFTEAGCVMIDSCTCEGCPGTFPTEEACHATCG